MTKKSKIILGILGAITPLLSVPVIASACDKNKPKPEPKPDPKPDPKPEPKPDPNKELEKNKIEELRIEIASKASELKTKESQLEELKKSSDADSKATEISNLEASIQTLSDELFEKRETIAKGGEGTDRDKSITAAYIISLNSKFEEELNKESIDQYNPAPTKEEEAKIVKAIDKYIGKIDLINSANLTEDSLAWAKGLKYNWEIDKGNRTKGSRYLLSSFNWGPSNAYAGNSFYGTISGRSNWKANRWNQWLSTLKEAVTLHLVPSKVWLKANINLIMKRVYNKQLQDFLNGEETEKTLVALIDSAPNNTEDLKAKNAFFKYYVTEYYNASTYGLGENLTELKVFKQNTLDEKEQTIEVLKNGRYEKVYGLGFTEKDLNQNQVGIGYMPGTEGQLTGKDVYNQYLKMVTTSELTPDEVYQKGYSSAKGAAENMKKIATEVSKLIKGESGEWAPTIKYDADGPGPDEVQDLKVTIRSSDGTINLGEFNKWLNSEEFFFGREDKSFYTNELKESLLNDQTPGMVAARASLTKLGYDPLKGDETKYNGITNDQFYYGALESFKWYNQFKATTQAYGAKFFGKTVPDYGIDTYEYANRTNEGVGAYNGSVKNFFFNADPYYSLPKWSVTSFANHESMMGHHNQIKYAELYLAKIDGQNLGSVFDYTSYVEGWALFMEWFGIENGFYGTPDYESTDYYAMPKDFSLSKGITSFFTSTNDADITPEMIKQIKELHGGVYWKQVSSVNEISDEKEHAKKAVKLANMLQYFGALNEAQLRNMRLALDTSYHGIGVQGKSDLPAGASIKQVREFMKANSALGIGDINSESRRYLSLPGQATAYNSGKEVMLDLYKKVQNKLGFNRKQFIEATTTENGKPIEHGEIKKFFDILLRNSALPMDTLKSVVYKVYNITE
ncbi:DUF885 family protein [[Mycoplasma] anseris]|uniref:DUF885 family protein n=1 Tax=[Mycoplasma] anseris TaxID=92400 RepID=A0A2Z4NC96_9BACT|nr:DUF885 family protein [[Mycoplasma] anseris]AWX69159.1 DUF885 family protein [[Mycoplasma] anseris]